MEYTTPDSTPLTTAPVDPATVSEAQAKAAALRDAYQAGKALTVVLSEAELRAVIQESSWRNMVDFQLLSDKTTASFSFPLAMLGDWEAASVIAPDLNTRWANGTASGIFAISDGAPSLSLSELTLSGKELGDMARGHAAEWISGAIASYLTVDQADGGSGVSILKTVKVENGSIRLEIAGKP